MNNADRLDAITAAHRERVAATGAASMADRTWADLNMDEVFSALDGTASTLGRQALYHRLRTVHTGHSLDAFDTLVERITTDTSARTRATQALGRLRDAHGYNLCWLAGKDALEVRPWHVVFPFLTTTTTVMLLALLLTPWWPRVVPVLIVTMVTNLIVRFSIDRRVLDLAGAFRQLAPVIAIAQSSRFLRGEAIDPFMLAVLPNPPAVILTDFSNTIYDYLNTCLAAGYAAPVFQVRSGIGRANDLLAGKSSYIVEVESLLELVKASASVDPHLFLLDELFRGTNTVERIATGQAMLEALLAAGTGPAPHVVMAATHDSELVDLLPTLYTPYHFGDFAGPEGLTFDHKLQPGPATSRNAITLLRLSSAPERLVQRATERAAALGRQRGITPASR